jgi:hypothetical protein
VASRDSDSTARNTPTVAAATTSRRFTVSPDQIAITFCTPAAPELLFTAPRMDKCGLTIG